jgi:hypothetical protein
MTAYSSVIPAATVDVNASKVFPPVNFLTAGKLATMRVKDFEKITHQKLTLKEKMAFKIFQHKLKKELKAKEKGKPSKGKTAMILGIISLVCIIIPYGFIASIVLAVLAILQGRQARKENPNDGQAQAGIILGIVSLGLILLAFLLVIAIIASWSWGW